MSNQTGFHVATTGIGVELGFRASLDDAVGDDSPRRADVEISAIHVGAVGRAFLHREISDKGVGVIELENALFRLIDRRIDGIGHDDGRRGCSASDDANRFRDLYLARNRIQSHVVSLELLSN